MALELHWPPLPSYRIRATSRSNCNAKVCTRKGCVVFSCVRAGIRACVRVCVQAYMHVLYCM